MLLESRVAALQVKVPIQGQRLSANADSVMQIQAKKIRAAPG